MKIAFAHFIFLVFLSTFAMTADVASIRIAPQLKNNSFMEIEVLDQKILCFDYIDNIQFSELSGLAYHGTQQTLHMASDQGALFSFRAVFSDKIDVLEPLSGTLLKDRQGKTLRFWKRDSEGVTLDGKGRLLISFEGSTPKIGYFHKNSVSYGNLIRQYRLPKILRDADNYRSKNKSLEALSWHKKYGVLTATEWPLKKDDKKLQTIYALNGPKWHFNAEPESKSAVVAMEVMDDENILVMERSYTGMFEPLVITLKKVMIQGCKFKICQSKVLAKMNSHRGWNIDNFEGLAKVGKDRYLIISDDNNNVFQKTLLLYFKVKY
ncbi:MAG: Bll0177 protein [uncultured Sulfurovum sp.]|uniref:Bll0177 protein n=1 Tax=uncultured Sulfurovum sp. TaxID=269237 RepID=A0A6S6TCX2_9BACT|nr:MAG: Bll0177 protein [uncultured Sulfurovum sp.]